MFKLLKNEVRFLIIISIIFQVINNKNSSKIKNQFRKKLPSDVGMTNKKPNADISIKRIINVDNNSQTIVNERKIEVNVKKIDIKIYYDSLCSDSVYLFRTTLKNFYNNLDDFKDRVNFNLYPGGLEQYSNDNNEEFICKHGFSECEANSLHICALHILSKNVAWEYIFCSMENLRSQGYDIYATNEYCSKYAGANHEEITKCAQGEQGRKLMMNQINQKSRLAEEVRHSPWILIDEYHDLDLQYRMEQNFSGEICRMLRFDQKIKTCSNYERYNLII